MNSTYKLAILIVLGVFVFEVSATCVHGTAKSCGGCTCDKNSTTGYWMGADCNTCLYNFFGTGCDKYCKSEDTCGGFGTCNTTDGSCICDMFHKGAHCTGHINTVFFTVTVEVGEHCNDTHVVNVMYNGTSHGYTTNCSEVTSARKRSTTHAFVTFSKTILASEFKKPPQIKEVESFFYSEGIQILSITITDTEDYGNTSGQQSRSLKGRTLLPLVDLTTAKAEQAQSGWSDQQLQDFQF